MILFKKNLGNSHNATVVGGSGCVLKTNNRYALLMCEIAGGIITIVEFKSSKAYQLFLVCFKVPKL